MRSLSAQRGIGIGVSKKAFQANQVNGSTSILLGDGAERL